MGTTCKWGNGAKSFWSYSPVLLFSSYSDVRSQDGYYEGGGKCSHGSQIAAVFGLVKKKAKSVYLSSQRPNFEELKMRALVMMGFRRSAIE